MIVILGAVLWLVLCAHAAIAGASAYQIALLYLIPSEIFLVARLQVFP